LRVVIPVESVDALDDLGADSCRERRLGADLDEARSSDHVRRRVVSDRREARVGGRGPRVV
jgi:hypothetical protein